MCVERVLPFGQSNHSFIKIHEVPRVTHIIVVRNLTKHMIVCGYTTRENTYQRVQKSKQFGDLSSVTGAIHSPVNAKKVGKIIDPDQTTPYTAMPRPKVSPLMLLCDYD